METRSTDWVKFFKESGLPSSTAAKYAVTFSNHRIQSNMLRDLSKEILYDMGIKTMGDVIAILRHAKEVDEEAEKAEVLKQSASFVSPSSSSSNLSRSTKANLTLTAKQSVKRPLDSEKPTANISNKIQKISPPSNLKPNEQQSGSIEYLSKGSTYVIKMPNFAPLSTPSISNTNTASVNSNKSSIFSRLGAPTTLSQGQPSTKISLNSNSLQYEAVSSSVFARLGNDSLATPAPTFGLFSKSNSSILRGAEGATTTMFSGKMTATVKPTNLLIRKAVNSSAMSNQQGNMISINRHDGVGVKNRLGIVANNQLSISNKQRTTNQLNKTIITREATRRLQPIGKQTVSLKKSVFDRLGHVKF